VGESTLEALMAADHWEPFKAALVDAVNSGLDGQDALTQLVNDDDVAGQFTSGC
jgi:hypothetical protein